MIRKPNPSKDLERASRGDRAAKGLCALAAVLLLSCSAADPKLVGLEKDPSSPLSGPCQTGAQRSCATTLGQHEDVLTCYYGTQTCNEGFWSACGYGAVKSGKPRAELFSASGRSPLALGESTECTDNPCNPDCNSFEEFPDDPIGSSMILDGQGSTYEWTTGSFSSLSSTATGKGINQPCSTGNDCQFNTYCFAPSSTGCGHSLCSTGLALDPACNSCVADVVTEIPLCGVDSSSVVAGAACAHSLCEEGDPVAENCSTCAGLICDADPDCCDDEWDASCVAMVASVCSKTCECGAGEQLYNGRCYYKEEANLSWTAARTSCLARGNGWEFASIADNAESNFINSSVIDTEAAWIGFTSGNGIGSAGIWAWSSGDPSGTWEEPAGGGSTGFAYGSSWKYNASGNDPGGSWNTVAYDDSGWSTGNGQFGFGESDQSTDLPNNGSSEPSYYFRKSLTLSDITTSPVTSATLKVLYDDGYYAYVNGTLVDSVGVSGTSHGTAASGTGENTVRTVSVTPGLFVTGTNVIAVVIKNRTNNNSNRNDLSFDAELTVETSSPGVGIYQNFKTGNPDGGGVCAHFESNRNGKWEDDSCSSTRDSVCEGPPLTETGDDPAPESGAWTAISYKATWKYSDSSTAPSSSWKDPTFNDSSWSSGSAQFGFGDGDEGTTVATGRASYYFRKSFNLTSNVDSAAVSLIFDDGAQVYVNGTAVMTANVSGTGHTTYATTTSDDDEQRYSVIDTDSFVTGTNTIAVLVKNVSKSSSDVSFDLKLDLNLCPVGGCPPVPEWSQDCVDAVATTCDVSCDPDSPLTGRGICIPHYPGETDPNCAGLDLAVGVPCDGNVPVCNHGQSTAPSGLRLVHFPADFGGFATCTPDQGTAGMEECFTEDEIPPGSCIDVTSCTGLADGREIMINPPGSDHEAECSCRDNWSIYDADACGPPICSGGSSVATLTKKPVDIIFVIDNSGSMSGEISQVQDRINEDFADIISSSGIDYRVIMMSRYGQVGSAVGGSDHPICVKAPLGGHTCSSPTTQAVAHNPPFFYHFSTDVGSTDGLCRLIQGLSTSDELTSTGIRTWTPVAPGGYDDLLRPEALKQIVVITDDDVSCSWNGYSFSDGGTASGGETAANSFDTVLTTLSPSQFGTAADRNYVFHSIVAMTENSPGTEPWPASESIKTGTCSPGSDGPGTGYQALSRLTGGLRYPTCRNDDFNAIFTAIAEEVVEGAELSCAFDLVNEGQFDPETSTLTFIPGGGTGVEFTQVADATACGATSYYYEDGDTISLCPDTCSAVQNDDAGQLAVEIECLPLTDVYETFEFTQTYVTECDSDKEVQWGFLSYDTVTPGDSSIDFQIRVADTQAELASAPFTSVAIASAALGSEKCALTGPSPCPIDLWDALGGRPQANKPFMELQAVIAPTSDGSQSPTLNHWRIIYSCEFDH